jgi:hypothetical protein
MVLRNVSFVSVAILAGSGSSLRLLIVKPESVASLVNLSLSPGLAGE